MELKILQQVRASLQNPSKTDLEKTGALTAALQAFERLQFLEKSDPKLFARVKKTLEDEPKKSASIKDLQP